MVFVCSALIAVRHGATEEGIRLWRENETTGSSFFVDEFQGIYPFVFGVSPVPWVDSSSLSDSQVADYLMMNPRPDMKETD